VDIFTVLLVIVLLAVGAGGATYALHTMGWAPHPELPPPAEPDPPIEALPAGAEPPVEVEIERLRDDLRTWLVEQEEQRADQRARHDAELAELVSRGLGELRRDLEARTQVALERIHAEALAAQDARLARLDVETRHARVRERRAEALAEIYRRLARLEWAVTAVVQPIQLPGEPFTLPEKFLPETLKWETWKEVGEQAFAFADYFNQQRVLLEPPVAVALAALIATVRDVLTGAIYPNLQPTPTSDQLAALRAGLEQLGQALTDGRSCLDAQYRAQLAPEPEAD